MLILGTDSSAAPASAAVYDTEQNIVKAHTVINGRLTHSTTLMPMISDLLKNAEIDLKDIDLYAVSAGPGSFTGLRIGISAVKGMAFGMDKPCVAVTSGDAIAYNLSLWEGIICTAIDARVNQVYNAIYRCQGREITKIVPDRCITADLLAEELSGYADNIILAGDGAEIVKKAADGIGCNLQIAPAPLNAPTGYAVCFAAAKKQESEYLKPNELMPMYLKLPQAQRELMEKQKIKGEAL